MPTNLVIVESPAKAKTITKYLNSNKRLASLGQFFVMASMGHVRDLDKKALSIDIDRGFVPDYQVSADKKATVSALQKKAKQCDVVWLASDYDREGEGIAMHLREVLRLRSYKRITFTEITPRALEQAILNPRAIDEHLVDSQETRRILDRIVGYKISPCLWKNYKTENMGGVALSAGRVQSAVMHIIIEREREINEFASSSYWYFLGNFMLSLLGEPAQELKDTKLHGGGAGGTVLKESEGAAALGLLKRLKGVFKIKTVKAKERKVSPDLPFITSSLQQEASSKLGFGLKRTMQLAQELYEKGHITYMRTDSYTISDDFKANCQKYIVDKWGDAFYNASGSSKRKAKAKNAQEAHEAIRPTDVNVRVGDLDDKFSPDHKRLYDMIWKRTIASFMTSCIYEDLDIQIVDESFSKDNSYFQATFSKVKFNGYMVVYGVANDVYDYNKYINAINTRKYKLDCSGIVAKNTWQSPPQRYADASIIRVLESESIGRPSTYSGIMTKLYDKRYVIKSDVAGEEKPTLNFVYSPKSKRITEEKGTVTVGAERNKIVPTSIGMEIDKFLQAHFPYIIDKTFTASMEADLDKIAEGDKGKLAVLGGFWSVLKQDVEKVDKGPGRGKKQVLKSETYEHVVGDTSYTLRIARYGPVIQWQKDLQPDGKKSYISLKAFLTFTKKGMDDVDAQDIAMLVSLPKKIAKIRGSDFMLAYGPYGFYGKWQERNIKLPYKTIKSILEAAVQASDLEKAIDYVPKPRPTTA
jgi:DNA topoisomerase-1